MQRLQGMLHLIPLVLLWSTAAATAGGPLLSPFLPKKTFIITHTRFQPSYGNTPPPPRGLYSHSDSRTRVVFPQRPPLASQRLIHSSTRTSFPQQTGVHPQNQNVQQGPQELPYTRTATPQTQSAQQQPQELPRTRISNSSPHQGVPQRPPVTQSQPAASSNRIPSVFPPAVNPQENVVVKPLNRHPKCNQLPPPGDCRGAFPRYFYNSLTDQCDCFLYGGCGEEGLDYSFRSLEECQSSCVPANLEEGPVCNQLFQDEDYFYDVPEVPEESPSPPNNISPSPGIENLPNDVLLTILLRSADEKASTGGAVRDQRNFLRQ